MGNEASQEGGDAAQQQQQQQQAAGQAGPGPSRPGFMGMGMGQQAQVRPTMGGMTRGPRPTGPGMSGPPTRPIAQYPAGPDSVPRGQRPGMGGPIQVGVQPWADPPVQQPLRGAAPFRGTAPQQSQQQTRPGMGIGQQQVRGPSQQQQQQQQQQMIQKQQQQQQLLQKQQQKASEELGVDLSDLSEEERAKILSVMAKAHDMEEDLERHKRAKEVVETGGGPADPQRRPQLLCPSCRAVDLAVEVNKMCGDCGINYCQKCGTFVPGEGRRSVWVCNDCSIKRKEHSAAMATTQQQQDSSSGGATYTMAGQKMTDMTRRDDPAKSREYKHPQASSSSSVGDVVSLPLPGGPSPDMNFFYSSMADAGDIPQPMPDDLNGNAFADRSSHIQRMLEDEDEDDEDIEDYVIKVSVDDVEDAEDIDVDEKMQSAATTVMLQAIPFYDRSPGEVYTIPEEEEEMASPHMPVTWTVTTTANNRDLNSDTASCLLRWRGVGQTYPQPMTTQQQQQQQQQVPMQGGMLGGPAMGIMQMDQQSTSLIGGASVTSSSSGIASGSLLSGATGSGGGMANKSGSLVGAIPRTVPLMSLSQTLQQQQQQDAMQQQMWTTQQQQVGQQAQMQQWGLQGQTTQQQPQQMVMPQQQQQSLQYSSPKLKPKGMEVANGSLVQQPQRLKGQKVKQDQQPQQTSDWSPGTDLSPIMDVSPSLEAAEQEMMEKCQGDPTRPSIPRATSGTISGMLADFNKALGLATTPVEDKTQSLGLQDTSSTALSASQMSIPSVTTVQQAMTTVGGSTLTNVDQNQNLVQQQFQLQQQQMMIQQQQQMIQQQQQQLQQQAQMQQLQMQQPKQLQAQQQTLLPQQTMQQQQQAQLQQQPQQMQLQFQQTSQQLQPFQLQQQQQQQQMVGQQGMQVGTAGTQIQQTRKVHRRLPQPTVDQMKGTVTVASQPPKSKSRPPGTSPVNQRPVSPMMPRKSVPDLSQARYSGDGAGLLVIPASGQFPTAISPTSLTASMSTMSISPTPQQRAETETVSDPETGKSGKIRRRLPPVPLDQEPTSVPRRHKDRTRTLSMGATPLSSERSWDKRGPHRTTSLDGGLTTALTTLTTSAAFDYRSLLTTTSTTDSYLQYLTSSTGVVPSSVATTSSILSAITSYEIGGPSVTSMIGRRDLSAPHSLSSYLRTSGVGAASSLPSSYLMDHPLTSTVDPLSVSLDSTLGPTRLPSYMMSLKQQLREELRSVSEDRRRITDPDLSGLLSHSTWPGLAPRDSLAYDSLRKIAHSSAASSSVLPLASSGRLATPAGVGTTAHTSPRRSRHRRHASDTKLSMYPSLGRDEFMDDPLSRYKFPQYSTTNLPFKSFEFESIDDHLRTGGLLGGAYRPPLEGSLLRSSSLYPRRSSLTDPRIRDEMDHLMPQHGGKTQEQLRRYNRQIARLRRHTDTGLTGVTSLSSLGLGLDPYGRSSSAYATYAGSRRRRDMQMRKPRSWHPSPYVSEDEEEDQREEKKAQIKAEIARRRQQIEERLQDEAFKLSRLRDGPDRGYAGSPAYGDRLYTSPISLESGSSPRSQGSEAREGLSVLQAVDDILRKDIYSRRGGDASGSLYTTAPSSGYATDRHGLHRGSRYDRYYDPYYDGIEDTGGPRLHPAYLDELDTYDPALDYSPMELESPGEPTPMPLLPDMPTRSRKILEDLGSSPIVNTSTTRHRSSRSAQPFDDYVDLRHEDRSHRHRHQPGERSSMATAGSRSRKPQSSKASQNYDFPVKRILLTRDPKDRSVSGNGLGMKVVGGKEIPGSHGMIGAYVARIYPGGVVETLGEVREGDQILEWNGIPLTGKTYEEVQRIIASSGDEVELVIRSDFNMLTSRSSSHHHHSSDRHHQNQPHRHQSRLRDDSMEGGSHRDQPGSRSSYQHQGGRGDSYQSRHSDRHGGGYNRNYDSADFLQSPVDEEVHNSNYYSYRESHRDGYSSPARDFSSESRAPHAGKRSPTNFGADCTDSNKEKYRAEDISGEIQLQVCFDSKAAILYVTIVRARNLVTTRDNSGLPDPFVKCYLLPDRCVENERRTRYFSRCSDPEWKQTMVYPNVPADELKKHYLEISVWNYDINRPSEFLGEVILDLKDTSVIDEQSRWYKLHPHDPKKYPGGSAAQTALTSVNNESNMKMARLNNPGQKSHYLDGGEDIRKNNNVDKKFFSLLTKKSAAADNYTKDSEQPAMEDTNITYGKSNSASLIASRLPRSDMFHPLNGQSISGNRTSGFGLRLWSSVTVLVGPVSWAPMVPAFLGAHLRTDVVVCKRTTWIYTSFALPPPNKVREVC